MNDVPEIRTFNYQNNRQMYAGYVISIIMAITTFITFVFAMIAVPISGAFAPDGGISYPYLETLQQFPRDYIWQYLALVLVVIYLIQFSIIHSSTNENKKSYSQIALLFSVLSTIVLLITYYTQISVVPVSLLNNETQGIALLTQYNPHGLFIALEELGYILMIISFVALVPIFQGKGKLVGSIRTIYIVASAIVLIALIILSIQYGIDRKDRFEVIIISVAWLVLIINSILIGKLFKSHLKKKPNKIRI